VGPVILGFRNSGFQMSNNNANISRSFEKVRWESKFWDFETQGFGVSNVNKHARHFPRFWKGKVGPATLRFRNSGFQMSTTAQDISRGSEKVKWDPLLRDFRIYEHMVHKHKRKRKTEKRKVEASGFQDSKLREFKIHTSIYMNLRKGKGKLD